MLVTFKDRSEVPAAEAETIVQESPIIRGLEYELKATRDYLWSTIEELKSLQVS